MRYNDKELIQYCNENTPELEGVLQHMKPAGKEWSDWYQQTTFKERYFKLYTNLLFSFKLNDSEPLAVMVLENAHIAYEQKNIPFAFSITFRMNSKVRDNDIKHIFSCRCEADVNKWVSSLRTASYEYWRAQYHILRAKISMKTGDDPVLDYMKSNASKTRLLSSKSNKNKKKPSFFTHIDLGIEVKDFQQENEQLTKSTESTVSNSNNLIDL